MGASSRHDIRQNQSAVDRDDPLKAVTLPLRGEIHLSEEGLEAGVGAEGVEMKVCVDECHQPFAPELCARLRPLPRPRAAAPEGVAVSCLLAPSLRLRLIP